MYIAQGLLRLAAEYRSSAGELDMAARSAAAELETVASSDVAAAHKHAGAQ